MHQNGEKEHIYEKEQKELTYQKKKKVRKRSDTSGKRKKGSIKR